MKSIIELEDILHNASRRIRASKAPSILTTLTKGVGLSNLFNANVYFKEENRQLTGSFKYRGALNKILTLSPSKQNIVNVLCGKNMSFENLQSLVSP